MGQLGLARLDRTVDIDGLELVAEVGRSLEESNQAPFDLQAHVCALGDRLLDHAGRLDGQIMTTTG